MICRPCKRQGDGKASVLGFLGKTRSYFREYCRCTSIHGFRYFGEKRTYIERGWWLIVFIITLSVCVFLIRETYLKWERSPVIVSFATSETPIYNIPFPAVTICPETKISHSVYNHSEIARKLILQKGELNETESQQALYMSLVCEYHLLDYLNLTGQDTFTDDFLVFLEKGRKPIRSIFGDCKWMGRSIKCDEIFTPIMTDEGICYTFNMLDRNDIFKNNVMHYGDFLKIPTYKKLNWNISYGYANQELIDTYPRRALFSGAKNALSINLITFESDIDDVCTEYMRGYKVSVHTPMRIPRLSQQYMRVPLNEVVLGIIKPDMITTSDTVKVFASERRECFFQSERNLKYFKVYTQLNCQMECLTNFTLAMCGCVSFYMPRENGTMLCGAGSKDCMIKAEQTLQTKNLLKKLRNQKKNKRKHLLRAFRLLDYLYYDPRLFSCNCMPLCSDLTYNVEVSQSKWDWLNMNKTILRDYKDVADNKVYASKLILYFKTSQFVTSKRHELYGPTEFLANFGGLLGLFTGFSILSLMEIIYFLTVRICCNIKLHGRWYGPKN